MATERDIEERTAQIRKRNPTDMTILVMLSFALRISLALFFRSFSVDSSELSPLKFKSWKKT